MDVAMMQPAFLPWQGFFELIYKSERFIFLDDFQFSVQSYHQRNRLFVNKDQVDWYTVPAQKTISFGASLNQTRTDENSPWRKKMCKRMQQNYSKATYFNEVYPHVESWLLTPAKSLAEQNMAFIRLACELLGLQRDFRFSSQRPSNAERSQRVLELLHWCEADRYYCAKGSFEYMQEDKVFPVDGIEVVFQDYKPQEYEQVGSPERFVPFLSILDALFNIGPKKTAGLIQSGTKRWLPWKEMATIGVAVEQEVGRER